MTLTAYTADGRSKSKGQTYAPNGVVCSVLRSSNQSVPGSTWTKVQFDSRVADPFAFWDSVNYRFTPKVPGYYRVSAQILANTTATGAQALAGVYKNGVMFRRLSQFRNSLTGDFGTPGSCLVYFNGSTDYIEIWGYVEGSASFGGTASGEWTYADFELVASSIGVAPEPWHIVGATGEPAFLNGWVALGGTQPPPRFYKDPNGRVEVQVAAKNGTSDTPVFALPVGYRPGYGLIFSSRNGSTGGIYGSSVDQNGNCNTINMGANANIAFGFSFRAEQ